MQARASQVRSFKIKEVDFAPIPEPVIVVERIMERVVEDTESFRYFAPPKNCRLAKITDIEKPGVRPTLGVIAFHDGAIFVQMPRISVQDSALEVRFEVICNSFECIRKINII